ncbi:hypothetical protein [Priestia megaterium]|uniref:hypothetical protein n=1 Tax=Priestia megaterium TaxID=1404 RepID=UPI0035A89BF0
MSISSRDETRYYIVKKLKGRKRSVKNISTGTLYESVVRPYESDDTPYESTDTPYESTDTPYESDDILWEDSEPIYKSCVCELLDQIANKGGVDIVTGCESKLLLLNKHTSQPISVDGIEPTVFNLESFNFETGCAIFSFDREMMDSTTGSVKGTLIEDCDNISGILFIEDNSECW